MIYISIPPAIKARTGARHLRVFAEADDPMEDVSSSIEEPMTSDSSASLDYMDERFAKSSPRSVVGPLNLELSAAQASAGCAAASRGEFQLALSALSKAGQTKSDFQHLHFEMCSQLFLEMGEFFKAIITAQRALSIDSTYLHSYRTLARALREFGELEAARAAFINAIDLAPSSSELHAEISAELLELEQLLASIARRKRPVIMNDRLQGDLRFYELCGEVNHEIVPTWRSTKKPVCCRKT